MRPLMFAAICFLFLAAGPDASARAAETVTVVRPGSLYLNYGDGRLADSWQKELDKAEDAETLKYLIASIERDDGGFYPKFETRATLVLLAKKPNGSYLIVYASKADEFGFHFFITPAYRYKESDLEKLLKSAEIEVRIDGRPFGADRWTATPWAEGLVAGSWSFHLALARSGPPEDFSEFDGFPAALGSGRVMTVQTAFSNGDVFTDEFDLSDMGQALGQLRRQRLEIRQTIEARIAEMKKRLETLDQPALSNEAAAEGSGPVRTGN